MYFRIDGVRWRRDIPVAGLQSEVQYRPDDSETFLLRCGVILLGPGETAAPIADSRSGAWIRQVDPERGYIRSARRMRLYQV
jgi:hypothetical protein